MEAINLPNKQPEKRYRKIYNGLRRAVAPAISKFQFLLPSSFPHNPPTIYLYYVMRHHLMLHLILIIHQNQFTLLPTYSTLPSHYLHSTPNPSSIRPTRCLHVCPMQLLKPAHTAHAVLYGCPRQTPCLHVCPMPMLKPAHTRS